MGTPAVLAGLRVVHGRGLVSTAQEYGAFMKKLCGRDEATAGWAPHAQRMFLSSSTKCQAVFGAASLCLLFIAGCSQRGAPPASADGRVELRSAELRCEVESLDGLEPKVRQLASELGGFVARSERDGADDASSMSVTLRVPASKLDLALAALGSHGRVESRHETGEDFTGEYVDVDARRRNLNATRERLLVLLERAEKVDDALAVNRGLTELQTELDKVEGRAQFLEKSAAMSTVSATFHVGDAPWRPLEVARGAAGALLALLRGLANVAIVVAVFTPIWLAMAWTIRRLVRRRPVAA